MSKFKIGDRVVANYLAKNEDGYSITVPGWKGVVLSVPSTDWIVVSCLEPKGPNDRYRYTVKAKCFDLISTRIKRNLPAWF